MRSRRNSVSSPICAQDSSCPVSSLSPADVVTMFCNGIADDLAHLGCTIPRCTLCESDAGIKRHEGFAAAFYPDRTGAAKSGGPSGIRLRACIDSNGLFRGELYREPAFSAV